VVRLRLEHLAVGRDEFIKALRAEGIGSSVHFIPVHHHPFFQPYLRKGDAFPRADDFYSRCISLPIFPDMTDADVRDVADAVTRLAAHFART
jgi:perosamine synthetase